MDFVTFVVVLVLLWGCFHLMRSVPLRRRGKRPPGPYQFPIIGNALQLGKNIHQSLAKLSKKYGPLMSLQLGSIYTIVASSPQMAEEILQTEPFPAALSPSPYKATTTTSSQLPICRLATDGESYGKYAEKRCSLVINLMLAVAFDRRSFKNYVICAVNFTDFDSDGTHELMECLHCVGKIAAGPNVADFFPVLRMFNPQGFKREAQFYIGKVLGIIGDIINQRLEWREAYHEKKSDILEALLDLMEGSEYELSLEEIQHICRTETSSITVEWTLTELLLNPEHMNKATNEVRKVIGKNKRVEESDISRLPYLQALIKETFRYHPPAPLLVQHRAEDEGKINGYTIPKNTQILINIYAMGRDASIWKNPNVYEPERFLNNKLDFKGQDFELIPFGSGRRSCPGMALADRMVHLMLASLVKDFDWKVLEKIDVTEKFGLSLLKAVPLKAIPMSV